MKLLHFQVLSALLLVSVFGAVEKEGTGLVTGTIYVDDTREKNCTDTDNRDGIPGDNDKDIIIVDSELDTGSGSTSINVGGRNSIKIGGRPSKIGSGSLPSVPLLRPNTAGPLLELLQGLQGNIAPQPVVTSGSLAINSAPQPDAGAVLEFLKSSGIFNQGGIQGNIATQPLITPGSLTINSAPQPLINPGSLTINSAPQPNPGAVLEFLKNSGFVNQGGISGTTQPLVSPGQITISSAPQETSTSFVNTWNQPYEVVNEGSNVNVGSTVNRGSLSFTSSSGQTGKYLEILPGEDSYEYHVINDNIGSSGSNVRIPNRASISISSSGPRRVSVPDFDIGGRSSSVITTEQIPRRTTTIVRRPKVTYPSRSIVTYPSRVSKATITYPRQTVVSYPKFTREKTTRYPFPLGSKSTVRYPVMSRGNSVTTYPGPVRTSVTYPSQPMINFNRAVKSSTVMYPEASFYEGGYSEETEEFGEDEGFDDVEGGLGSGGASESAVFSDSFDEGFSGGFRGGLSGGSRGGLSGGYGGLGSSSGGSGRGVFVEGYYDSDGRWVAAHYDSFPEYLRHHAKK